MNGSARKLLSRFKRYVQEANREGAERGLRHRAAIGRFYQRLRIGR